MYNKQMLPLWNLAYKKFSGNTIKIAVQYFPRKSAGELQQQFHHDIKRLNHPHGFQSEGTDGLQSHFLPM